MDKDIAIKVEGVSKTFKIPHEKVSSLRGAAVAAFKKKSYEEFKALDGVSFEVKKGEFFGIIGRNGSGKSTLLKILAGIYEADKGKVMINGRISPFLELGIGFNPELSGRDNIYLNATVLGLTKKEIDEKFDSIVKFSELERFIDQKLKNYSSGMQVRLAFSVSIHANREILLMDEVLAVGDTNFQSKCLAEFNRYREMGKTVILVTHDIATVQRYCDRVLLLRNGEIVKVGNAEEVGDEYLRQNMTDEEARLSKLKYNNKNNNNEAAGKLEKKIAVIKRIDFLDESGRVRNAFKTGDRLSVRIYFKINEKKPKFNFGLSFYNIEKNYLFGTNTIFDNFETKEVIGRGYIDVNLNNFPYTNNSYYVSSVISGDDFKTMYSDIYRSDLVTIFCDKKCEGISYMEHKWE